MNIWPDKVESYDMSLVTLYHFFYVLSEGCAKDLSSKFTSSSIIDRITVDDCIAAISTVSSGLIDVLVHIAAVDARPSAAAEAWDHVTEFSLNVASGRMIVTSSLFHPDTSIVISTLPGVYRLRVHHNNLAAILAAYYAGDTSVVEEVWITAWQEAYSEPIILKRYP